MSKAVGQAAKLKAEIRLAQALSEFCARLSEPRSREFKTLRATSPPSPDDVVRLTEEVNRDGSRTHKAWRPYATKMALFLEKVQWLSRIGDVLLGSSQNWIASSVWTAVKVTLGIAVGSLRFFQRISDLFLKIGKASTVTKDLVELFPDSKELQDLMCEYLITLVNFCAKVVKELEKPTVLQLTCPFIAFFDKEASQFETDLAQWGIAIDKRVVVLLTRRQADSADTIAKIGRTLAQWVPSVEKKQQYLILRSSRLQEKLCSRQYERVAAWRRQRRKGTAEWLFKEQAYLDWKNTTKSGVLWIHGKLGSGKTVLLANIVAELYRLPQGGDNTISGDGRPIVTYHFCNHDRPDSNTYDFILGSVVQQIVARLEPGSRVIAEMDRYLQSAPCRPLEDEVIGILRRGLPRNRPVFMVLDALDECQEETAASILGALKSLSEVCVVRLCFSTRADAPVSGVIMSIFPRIDYQVSMSSPAAVADMESFVEAEFERRRHVRKLDVSLEGIVKDVLVGASEGMYLWVALQIETLFPLHGHTLLTDSDILRLLKNPPKDLFEVFDRALERISDPRYGKTIFQLVAAAKQPLTVAELRIALHVQPGNLDWNPMTIPKDGEAIISLCGGCLLEVDEEDDTVRFIHHSVRQHLVLDFEAVQRDDHGGASTYKFCESEADIHMGMVCVTYLRYSIFDTTLAAKSRLDVDVNQLTGTLNQLPGMEEGVASTLIAAIRRRRVLAQGKIDIGRILQCYLKPKVDIPGLLVFSDYAHEHWIWHTVRFWPEPCGEFKRYKKSGRCWIMSHLRCFGRWQKRPWGISIHLKAVIQKGCSGDSKGLLDYPIDPGVLPRLQRNSTEDVQLHLSVPGNLARLDGWGYSCLLPSALIEEYEIHP
ncbi:hypothetical protein QBC47DRAFT_465375 [Echria macrotheca]|uniref:NACHT domain-containing protein n=1 Tax=Echria macrotheca TaxID=438768 RepID=A0AAJ0B179_9PEZI|nr:hypothetical protein QBC47DRAFT_465375 [Echria macrotheca]